MNTCKGCDRQRPSSDFPIRGRKTNRRNTKISQYCRECTSIYVRNKLRGNHE